MSEAAHTETFHESELIAVKCVECGSPNALDGDKKGCKVCETLLDDCLRLTGHDLRYEALVAVVQPAPAPPAPPAPHSRVICEGGHKNGVRCVVTRVAKRTWKIEMWQRARWGCPYVQTQAGSVLAAYKAADAAIRCRV